jgi:hypothetical protein
VLAVTVFTGALHALYDRPVVWVLADWILKGTLQ